jgi:dienelactone hydrolase
MRAAIALIALTLTGCEQAPADPQASAKSMPQQPSMTAVTNVDFMADDGLTVSGRYYRAGSPKALILLFHQAGSSKDEYSTIAPRLVDMGFSALAIDQRSGGPMFGPNQTAARMRVPVAYGDALHDLEAALSWAQEMHMPIIVWGSSYSASLVFELAAKNKTEITAVLSFSPDEYLGPGDPVATNARQIQVPVFITSSSAPSEKDAAQKIFQSVPAQLKTLYVPKTGKHGSSTLIGADDAIGMEDNWKAVSIFLESATN